MKVYEQFSGERNIVINNNLSDQLCSCTSSSSTSINKPVNTYSKIGKPDQVTASELNLSDIENFPNTDNEPNIVRKSDKVQDKSDNSNHFLSNSLRREKPP